MKNLKGIATFTGIRIIDFVMKKLLFDMAVLWFETVLALLEIIAVTDNKVLV